MYSTFTPQLCRTAVMKRTVMRMTTRLRSLLSVTGFNIGIGSLMDSHVKAGWSGITATETRKPIWSWLANAFFFSIFMRVLQPQNWQYSICYFDLKGWGEDWEKKPKHTVETQPNISLLINGPWMRKTLPLSWHLLTLKKKN